MIQECRKQLPVGNGCYTAPPGKHTGRFSKKKQTSHCSLVKSYYSSKSGSARKKLSCTHFHQFVLYLDLWCHTLLKMNNRAMMECSFRKEDSDSRTHSLKEENINSLMLLSEFGHNLAGLAQAWIDAKVKHLIFSGGLWPDSAFQGVGDNIKWTLGDLLVVDCRWKPMHPVRSPACPFMCLFFLFALWNGLFQRL